MPRKFKNPVLKSLFAPVRHNQSTQNLNRPRKQGDNKAKPKKKRQQRKHVVARPEKKTAVSHKRDFRLKLPTSMPQTNEAVPWLAERDSTKQQSSAPSKKQTLIPSSHYKSHHGDFIDLYDQLVSPSARDQLNREILALAQYVQLTPSEHDARNAWLDQLTKLVQTTFSTHDNPHLQVYGSFATPGVCTFGSDIDTALWGVVPTEPPRHSTRDQRESISRKRSSSEATEEWNGGLPAKQAKRATKQSVPSQSDKYQKWLEALDAVPLADDTAEESKKPAATEKAGSSKTAPIDLTSPGKDEGAVKQSAGATVIMGDSVVHYDLTGSASSSAASSTSSSSDRDSISQTALGAAGVAQHNPRTVTESETDSDDSDISDDDFADKLANFARQSSRYHASQPSLRQGSRGRKAIIDSDLDDSEEDDDDNRPQLSLSCSHSEGETEDEADGHDVHVSFVAHGHRKVVSSDPMRMSRDTRDACVSALARLANRLRKAPHARRVELIKKARVPIIKMESSLGFEADVAIGGHNGTDTSAYAASLVNKYNSFGPVILLLKTILAQQKLDTPYHGGLGSYKLYVLVAYHTERHLSLGGRDEPGEIFLSFLYRFGKINPHSATHTRLSQYDPIRTANGHAEADLSNVFLLDHCVDLFAMCWMRLHSRLKEMRNDASSGRPSKKQKKQARNGPPQCSSALVVVIDCQTLSAAREEYGRKTRYAA